MRYVQQQDRKNDDYDRYRNYDDIEDADYERDGHGRSGGRGGMGRSYSDDRRGREMYSTGDRRASHDREFDRDYNRKFDRDSGYPVRRPEHDYDHSQERYSASHSRPHPSRLPRQSR